MRNDSNDPFLFDSHDRRILRLRLSLTEHCNFRCLYCMPPEGAPVHPQNQYLTATEILRLVKIFTEMGVTKIRLTGGEPLLRADLLEIIKNLRRLPLLQTLALTTNGSRLPELALPLREAGLGRLNVSLDSLNEKTFAHICKTDSLSRVITGIRAAVRQGFPVKLNAVLLKGVNDAEIFDFLQFASDEGIEEMRFIEFMPLCGTGWKPELVLPLAVIEEKIAARYGLSRLATDADSVAETYQIHHAQIKTRVGFIRTLSKPFCGQCSRIRLSATGFLQPCLFSHQGADLKDELRPLASTDTEIKARIRAAVWRKNLENEFAKAQRHNTALNDKLFTPEAVMTAYPSIRAIGG